MGRLASAAFVILLSSIVFPVFSAVALRKITPALPSVLDPFIVQYLIVLLFAPLYIRMVLVPLLLEVLEFVITKSFVEPVAFTLPSMVTLSAPFRSMSGLAIFPLMDNPLAAG